jgi:hypothetical protein
MALNRCPWSHPRVWALLVICCAATAATALSADGQTGGAGRWYKGNTHAHSLWSDGDDFPEMVAEWYKSHGYDFLAISDHNRPMIGQRWRDVEGGERPVTRAVVEKCGKRFGADWLVVRGEGSQRRVKLKTFDEVRGKVAEPGKFLLIQGEEISSKFRDCNVHVNAINLAEVIPPRRGNSVADTLANDIDAVERQSRGLGRSILSHVNHPNWSDHDISAEDLARTAAARVFEVCDACPDSNNSGDATHPSVEKIWDVANTIRIAKMKAPPLYGIGSDDAHHYQRFWPDGANPGRGWIMVRAKRLDADSLIDAMNRGDFYASTGVILRGVAYDAKRRTIAVKVQSEPGVRYTIEFVGTLAGVDPAAKSAEAGKTSKRPGRVYSPEIGMVLWRIEGDSATYHFSGKELYVRAVVRSDKPLANSHADSVEKQAAWCQPMGWERK